jgi:hypothetical protein
MKLYFFQQKLEKILKHQNNENQSIGSRFISCGQTDGWMGMTKLIVAFRNFANAPKNRRRIRPIWEIVHCIRKTVLVYCIPQDSDINEAVVE